MVDSDQASVAKRDETEACRERYSDEDQTLVMRIANTHDTLIFSWDKLKLLTPCDTA